MRLDITCLVPSGEVKQKFRYFFQTSPRRYMVIFGAFCPSLCPYKKNSLFDPPQDTTSRENCFNWFQAYAVIAPNIKSSIPSGIVKRRSGNGFRSFSRKKVTP